MTDVTRILWQIESGDPSAAEQLLPLVYEVHRKLAAARMASERPGQTLQATALVRKIAEYSATLKAWILYCITHPRSVEPFFDKDREANTVWQGFGNSRYASGTKEPIKLKSRSTHTIQN